MNQIVEAIHPDAGRGFWGLFESKGTIPVPPSEPGTALFLHRSFPGGDRALTRLSLSQAPGDIEGTKWDVFYRVTTQPIEIKLAFSALLQDAAKQTWELA